MRTYGSSISDFLRDDVFGVRRIVTFYNLWYQNRAVPRSFLLVRYEAMHADPCAVLAAVVEMLGVKDRKSVVYGTRVSVSVDLGGRRIIKKKTIKKTMLDNKTKNTPY